MKALWRETTAAFCSLLLLGVSTVLVGASAGWEIDATVTVTRVIDGDTFDAVPIGRVRLADINAPEVGEAGAQEATAFLTSLVGSRVVYLDIDDVHRSDPYGRIVAVVYVRHNSTHLLNVNAILVTYGHVDVWDHSNEFDPVIWPLYVYHPEKESSVTDLLKPDQLVGLAVLVMNIVVVNLAFPLLRRRKPL